jgi:hydroxypyruvate reductase
MKPDIPLIESMMSELEAKLDAAYIVHRLAEAKDPTGFIAQIAPSVRGIVTGGGTGASNAVVDALPKLEIIAINGVGTDVVDLVHAKEMGAR